MNSREFDVVVFGATGFAGRLVAEYLAQNAPAEARIALAGRNAEKLATVQRALGGRAKSWATLVADSSDPEAMKALAKRTRVVCTTVGPYAKYGLPLVGACAADGTHYCDLAGEVQFVRDAIDRFDAEAKRTGARIVPSCGFDSIPSDLGVLLLHRALGKLSRATYVVEAMKGGFSGGTFASLLNALEEGRTNRARRRLMADPYALSPDRSKEPDLGNERDLATYEYDPFVGRWVAPFVMASVNTRVVRRSNALLDYGYGTKLRYREVSGMKSRLRAMQMTAMLGAFMAGLSFGPTRTLLMRVLPKPGEGPSEHARKTGKLRVRIFGESEDGRRASVLVKGEGDPGYALTAVMLGQAALCLAFDQSRIPPRAGVLTPATAMGEVLVDRLRAAGMTFTVE